MFDSFKRLMLTMGVFSVSLAAAASDSLTETNATADLPADPEAKAAHVRESIFGGNHKPLSESHFTWGAEFGTSIDLSGYDTSTFNIDAVIGYKKPAIRLLGIGAGIHRAFGTGDNFIPVYGIVRTSFSKRARPFFLSFKAGYSFNTIGDAPMFGDVNAALGAGLNLAVSKSFQSHIVLAYEFRHFNKRHKSTIDIQADDIALATLSFGVNF